MLGFQSQILEWLINPLLPYIFEEIHAWLISNILDNFLLYLKGEISMKVNLIINTLLSTAWNCK